MKIPHKNADIANQFIRQYYHPMCWAGWPAQPLTANSPDGPWGQSMRVTQDSQRQEGAAMRTDPALWP